MSILDIRVLGDPILRQATTPVTAMTDELRRLIADMFETMHHARGIGLAAPQVGRTERIAVVEVDEHRLVLINPEIVDGDGRAKGEEGCLSIPDIYADVERPKTVTVRARDEKFELYEVEATDMLARCLHLKRTAALAKWKLEQSKYPGYIRRVSLETPEDLSEHEHPDEEL